MKKGIAAAGNLMVDVIKEIEAYPARGKLTTVVDVSYTTGGLCPNCLIDIAKMDPDVPLECIGLVGNDDYGELLINKLSSFHIDVSHIKRHDQLGTSFTDVMNEPHERTFFTYRGANAAFGPETIDWDNIQAELIHFGYILLLDTMDMEDAEYGTVMARTLAMAQKRGFKTSIDVVSEQSDRFARLVPPSLRYTDYCVINEIEASMTTGIPVRSEDGVLLRKNMEGITRKIRMLGVSTWVVIHCPEGSFGLDENDMFHEQPTINLPKSYIVGKTGAGDAFCAAVLYAANQGQSLPDALLLAGAAAASCLSKKGSTEGILPVHQLMALYDQFGVADF